MQQIGHFFCFSTDPINKRRVIVLPTLQFYTIKLTHKDLPELKIAHVNCTSNQKLQML